MDRLRGLSRGGRLLLALAVGGGVFAIASAVYADIPDSGVIHTCYSRTTLALHVIDSDLGQHCNAATELALSWNQTGPTGATGATGAIGATGATGVAGGTGPSGATGATGAAGVTGATGPAGSSSPSYFAGSSGGQPVTGESMPGSVTLYVGVGGFSDLVEAPAVPVPVSGTLSNLYVNIRIEAGTGNSWTFTVLKNKGATPLTCTMTNPAVTCSDTTHTASFNAGDTLELEADPSSDNQSPQVINWSVRTS
jgi:hypothetical protein